MKCNSHLLIFLLSVLPILNVLSVEIEFEHLSSRNGLSQNDVLSIFQDSDGLMWFGTIDGLNRYDGYDFLCHRSIATDSNSLRSNLVSCLIEDRNKNLWIGTLNKGISKYNLRTQQYTHYYNTPEHPNQISHNEITELFCDSKNRIWAATREGITLFTPTLNNTYKITTIVLRNENPGIYDINRIETIYEDSKNRIWYGAHDGLHVIPDTDSLVAEQIIKVDLQEWNYQIREILEYPKGYVISHFDGLLYLEFSDSNWSNPSLTPIGSCSAHQFTIDNDSNIWASGHNGIHIINYLPDTDDLFEYNLHIKADENPETLNSSYIRSLYIDSGNRVWVGTNGAGISIYNPGKTKIQHYRVNLNPGSISNNKIWSIYEDPDLNIWIGTEGGGINLLPVEREKEFRTGFEHLDVNPSYGQNFVKEIKQITFHNQADTWAGVGFPNRLIRVTKKGEQWHTQAILEGIAQHTFCIEQDENGAIWLGTYNGGLYKYLPNKPESALVHFHINNSALPSNIIRQIKEDTKGRLWIATSEGLALLTRQQKQMADPRFTIFQHDANDSLSLSNNYIVPILESSTEHIWLGTFGGGINLYQEGSTETNGTFRSWNTQNGLPNDMIKQLVEDNEGYIWISSNRGITRFNPDNFEVRNFDIYDGLQDWEFTDVSGCRLHDGQIIFGGKNGFNVFYPDELKQDTLPARLIFTRLDIFNEAVEVGKTVNGRILLKEDINYTEEVKLSYKENNFTIHFSGLHYSAPRKIQYQYMLKGYDDQWYYAQSDHRFSRYTNMSPGKYTFKFKAANHDGIWTKDAKHIDIIITPPFWSTLWFRGSSICTLATLIFLLVYIRIRKEKVKNQILEKEVEKRTLEIRSKNHKLREQAEVLNETNTILEERQQKIEEQAKTLLNQRDDLYETNTQLEERQQRIEELVEELSAQRDELTHVNSVKDKLFSIVAHDLKNPFNTLTGFLEILSIQYDKYDETKRKMMITYALQSSKNIEDLLHNLLHWARSQTGNISISHNTLNISELLQNSLTIANIQAHQKMIRTRFHSSPDMIMLHSDENMIRVIVRNLLSNAIKFTPQNGTIEVLCQLKGQEVEISIKDTGIGIPAENLKNLFRKDMHISTFGTSDEKGTGIGLITCKEFAEMLNGSISVSSEVNKGTTFTLSLPVSGNRKD